MTVKASVFSMLLHNLDEVLVQKPMVSVSFDFMALHLPAVITWTYYVFMETPPPKDTWEQRHCYWVPKKGNVNAPSQLQDKEKCHFWSQRLWSTAVTNTEKKQCLSGALTIPWYRTKVEEQKELLGGIGGGSEGGSIVLMDNFISEELKLSYWYGSRGKICFSMKSSGLLERKLNENNNIWKK